MPQELLTELAQAAGRLKDANGVPIGELCVRARDVWRAAWHNAGLVDSFEPAQQEIVRLFDALRNNQLYPYPRFLENPTGVEPGAPIPPDDLRDAFNRLKPFCVVNRYGTGELVLMYVLLMQVYGLCQPGPALYSIEMCRSVGSVAELRPPTDPDDNLAPFSDELKARCRALLQIHAMKELGCLDDEPVERPMAERWAEVSDLFSDGHSGDVTRYIPDAFRAAYDILDASFLLMTYARQKDTGSAIRDPRPPADLFHILRVRLKELRDSEAIGTTRKNRLLKLAITGLARILPYLDRETALEIYRFLRRSKSICRVHHGDMFYLMPDRAARLDLLNFLHHRGKMEPDYLQARFSRYFPVGNLRFVSEKGGFAVDLPKRTRPMSKARYFKALAKRKEK